MKIYAFHLLNDYSGSPKVLMQLVKGWLENGHDVHVVTSSGREGFLSGLQGAKYHFFYYQWSPIAFFKLMHFAVAQLSLFFKMLFVIQRDDIVYINTVLPFAGAFLGRIKGCKVVYHIHETSIKPLFLKKMLFAIAQWAASDVVYVSSYLAQGEMLSGVRQHVLYNALEPDFMREASLTMQKATPQKNVLMVCSLKTYKGIDEFLALAHACAHYSFQLVVNASYHDIVDYLSKSQLPGNVSVFPTSTNLHPHYRWADVVLNLSRPDEWIETFGLTILEGMAYGLPAIVPPIGGITELVEEKEHGFRVNGRDTLALKYSLAHLFDNHTEYKRMSTNARKKVAFFDENAFVAKSLTILELPR